MNRRTLLAALGCAGALAGCAAPLAPDAREREKRRDVDSPPPAPPASVPLGYTHLRPDGNRFVDSFGSLPETDPVDVALDARPEWVVGVPREEGVLLGVVTSEDAEAVSVGGREAETADVDLGPARGPPLLVGGSDPRFAPALGSPTTHPVPTTGGWASVTTEGRVRLPGGTNADVDALPDARIVSAAGRLYVLAGRTNAYAHGVLGDELEARSVAVLDPAGGVETTLEPPSGVIEGIAPIVADVDDDGEREVVVTVSDAERGARLVALSESGETLAGPPVGSGFRWRHQLAVAPFGPDGDVEIAAVKTPHVGGTAEFYRADGDALRLVAERRGYSTHAIGSRNLDGAVAGDLDGDGRVELLVPDDSWRELAGLRRVDEGGVEEPWRLPLGGRLTTNLCAVSGERGVVVAAGFDQTLRVWPT
ncbi:hypothetical protein C2R22_06185 [Salinigranum rubrum]|uniref:VCBS repeat-containing protein n=1 Tax=Salinigranum rubrum TaxID=755307 RepID=A0A2I8VHA0_9EURY|nr:hypothetical protein [Salinigranum rubrum]AUV81305.1 hypothetical protein C2R22_06185 [Salinigranum rubrum]